MDEEQAVKAEVYMSILQTEQMTHQEDSSLQKNSSEDKAANPEQRSEELSEVFTLQDQLKQAEERASQVQREVRYSHQDTAVLLSSDCLNLVLSFFLSVIC